MDFTSFLKEMAQRYNQHHLDDHFVEVAYKQYLLMKKQHQGRNSPIPVRRKPQPYYYPKISEPTDYSGRPSHSRSAVFCSDKMFVCYHFLIAYDESKDVLSIYSNLPEVKFHLKRHNHNIHSAAVKALEHTPWVIPLGTRKGDGSEAPEHFYVVGDTIISDKTGLKVILAFPNKFRRDLLRELENPVLPSTRFPFF